MDAGFVRRRLILSGKSSHPVSQAAKAAVCKTVQPGATPGRDSISPGISVERYTPVFQAGLQGAIELPVPPQVRFPNDRRSLRDLWSVMPDQPSPRLRLGRPFPRREYRCRPGFSQIWLRWFNSAFASRFSLGCKAWARGHWQRCSGFLNRRGACARPMGSTVATRHFPRPYRCCSREAAGPGREKRD